MALAGTAVAAFISDRVSKALIVRDVVPREGDSVAVIPPIFSITNVHNTGVAFGLFTHRNLLFGAVALVVLLIILNFYRQLPDDLLWLRISLGLQAGGAVGNIVDRVTQGYVTDFLDFHFWPVFNVADSCVCVGVAMLAIYLVFSGSGHQETEKEGNTYGSSGARDHPRLSDR